MAALARPRPSVWRRFFRRTAPATPAYLPNEMRRLLSARLERPVRNALWKLCLVSKRLNGPASEALYGNVTLSSSTMRKFYFTIATSPIHAELVRHLRYAYSSHRAAPRQQVEGPSWLSELQLRRKLETFALQRCLPRLHAIVWVSDRNVAAGYAPIRVLSWLGSAGLSNSPGQLTSYQKLESIALVSEDVRYPQANIGAVARVFRLPKLRTLRLKYFSSGPYLDGAVTTLDSFINGDKEAPRTIVNLSLGGCKLSKEHIAAISRRVAPLYSFSKHGLAHYHSAQDQSAQQYMKASKHSNKTLETLSLELGSARTIPRRSPVWSSKSPAEIAELHGPVDLSQFVALKHVRLTAPPIFAVDDTRFTRQQLSFGKLPASLETLHLEVIRSYCGFVVIYPSEDDGESITLTAPQLSTVMGFLFKDLRDLSRDLPILRQVNITVEAPDDMDMDLLRGLLLSVSSRKTCQFRLFIRRAVFYDQEVRGMVEDIVEVKELPAIEPTTTVEEEHEEGAAGLGPSNEESDQREVSFPAATM